MYVSATNSEWDNAKRIFPLSHFIFRYVLLPFVHWYPSIVPVCNYSKVFQLPEGRMLTYFGIVPEDSLLDVPNAALGAYDGIA